MAAQPNPSQARIAAVVDRAYHKFDQGFLNNNKVGESFESILKGLYQGLLSPGDIAIDIGANYGLHTLPMAAAVGPSGRVHAFEPIPQVADSLAGRIAAGCPPGVVLLHRVALSNYRGQAEFVCVEADYGYSGLKEKHYPFEPRKKMIQVQVETLDSLVPATERVAFVKLDIEGGEFHALQGAVSLLRAQRPVLVFENGKQGAAQGYGYTRDDFFAFFRSLDYDLRDILGCPMYPEQWRYVGPWYTVACPMERSSAVSALLSACVAEQLFSLQW